MTPTNVADCEHLEACKRAKFSPEIGIPNFGAVTFVCVRKGRLETCDPEPLQSPTCRVIELSSQKFLFCQIFLFAQNFIKKLVCPSRAKINLGFSLIKFLCRLCAARRPGSAKRKLLRTESLGLKHFQVQTWNIRRVPKREIPKRIVGIKYKILGRRELLNPRFSKEIKKIRRSFKAKQKPREEKQ